MSKELEALKAALPYMESAAVRLRGYGFFPGGDPRNFTPDGENPQHEIDLWKADCAAAGKGQVRQDPAGKWIVIEEGKPIAHILTAKYGTGVYTYQDEEAVAALTLVKEAIAALDGFPVEG